MPSSAHLHVSALGGRNRELFVDRGEGLRGKVRLGHIGDIEAIEGF